MFSRSPVPEQGTRAGVKNGQKLSIMASSAKAGPNPRYPGNKFVIGLSHVNYSVHTETLKTLYPSGHGGTARRVAVLGQRWV